MKVDQRLLTGLAPVLLESGFNTQEATAIAASIASIVQVISDKQDEKINELASMVEDASKLAVQVAELVEMRSDEVKRLAEAVEKLENQRD